MDTKPDVIDQSRVTEGILFATHRDRGLYIGTLLRNRRQWLKDHPDAWRRVQEVEQEAALLRRCLETPVEATAAGPSLHISSPDVRNDGKDADNAHSVEFHAGDPSPPRQRPTDAAPSAPGDEIAIGTER